MMIIVGILLIICFVVYLIIKYEFSGEIINSKISNIMNKVLLIGCMLLTIGIIGGMFLDIRHSRDIPIVEQYKIVDYKIKKDDNVIMLEYVYIDDIGMKRVGKINIKKFKHIELNSTKLGTLTIQYLNKYGNFLFLTEEFDSKICLK